MWGINLENPINEEEFKEFIRLIFKPPKRDSLCIFNGEVMTMGEWWNKFKREEKDDIATD